MKNNKTNKTAQPERMNLESLDVAAEKRELLRDRIREAFPEALKEDMVDFDQLKRTLGEWVEPEKERFGLNWHGKAKCMQVIQQPSVATLKPSRDESVNFDETENLFIEGDNLEVLKLLQKSYFGKVKMIYIDPPYNTGKEFIYPDKYGETLDTYLEYTGQKDSEGRKFSTNTETSGRYHSRWLSMMYPRLYLAKNLLREDGVIFISIDDNEVAHLRELCDLVFGEENFSGAFVVNSTPNARDYGHIGKMHEYVLMYVKDTMKAVTHQLPEHNKKFKYVDEKGGFNIHPLYNSNIAFNKGNCPKMYYPFYINPISKNDGFYEIDVESHIGWEQVYPPKSLKEGVQFVWRWSKNKSLENLNKEIIGYKTNDGEFRIVQKMRHSSKRIRSLLVDKKFSTRTGTAEVESIFSKKIFSFPKPMCLIKDFVLAATADDDIVLDFFAGSGTTAHAVMQLNAEDGGCRKFICVQLPEPCDAESEAYKAGYKTIADIGKERIRRMAKKIDEAQKQEAKEKAGEIDFAGGDSTKPSVPLDLGFKVFKLASSNFKLWDGYAIHRYDKAWEDYTAAEKQAAEETLLTRAENHVEHTMPNSAPEDILYEILLKAGYPLTAKVEDLAMAGKKVFSIEDKNLLVCLDEELNQAVIDAIAEVKPQQAIFLDAGFKGNDQLKANAVQTFKARAQEEETEILFRTI